MSDVLLDVQGLSAGYLGQDVIHDIDLSVRSGEVVTVIGSNGAGKSTMFRAICSLMKSTGSVTFAGANLAGQKAHQVVRSGMVYVPAERHLFPTMSVRENLILGAYPRRPNQKQLDLVHRTFPRLEERSGQHAGTMSGGEQQMLAVGRALMSSPRILLLDEPSTGLSPLLATEAYSALADLREQGLTILVAEQQVPLALRLADRGYVLDHGRVALEGTAEDLAADPGVRRAYLGIEGSPA